MELNKMDQVVEIDDDDEVILDFIDLDVVQKTRDEIVFEWDAKIRKKLIQFALDNSENLLNHLMKDYLESLQDMAQIYEENEALKDKVFDHITFFHVCFIELECCMSDDYLSNMEDMLSIYCNLEMEMIRQLKKSNLKAKRFNQKCCDIAKKMNRRLKVCLLNRHDHILHVLIKINTDKLSDSCSGFLNIIYDHFLCQMPVTDFSDESFCRYYILFQKWKDVNPEENWKTMDTTLYLMLRRTSESIKKSETLKKILTPSYNRNVEVVMGIFNSLRAISNGYFKHIKAKKRYELDQCNFNFDITDDNSVPAEVEEEDEVEFLQVYDEIERNMSNLSPVEEVCIRPIKTEKQIEEEEEDDDIEFIENEYNEPASKTCDIVDEEISEILNKSEEENRISSIDPTSPVESCFDLFESNLNGVCITSPQIVLPLTEVTEHVLPETPESSKKTDNTDDHKRATVLKNTKVVSKKTKTVVAQVVDVAPMTEGDLTPKITERDVASKVTESDLVPKVAERDTPKPSDQSTEQTECHEEATQESAPEVPSCDDFYGFSTPPFVPGDQTYVDNPKRSQQAICAYDDWGLTPPNDSEADDHVTQQCETKHVEDNSDTEGSSTIDTGQVVSPQPPVTADLELYHPSKPPAPLPSTQNSQLYEPPPITKTDSTKTPIDSNSFEGTQFGKTFTASVTDRILPSSTDTNMDELCENNQIDNFKKPINVPVVKKPLKGILTRTQPDTEGDKVIKKRSKRVIITNKKSKIPNVSLKEVANNMEHINDNGITKSRTLHEEKNPDVKPHPLDNVIYTAPTNITLDAFTAFEAAAQLSEVFSTPVTGRVSPSSSETRSPAYNRNLNDFNEYYWQYMDNFNQEQENEALKAKMPLKSGEIVKKATKRVMVVQPPQEDCKVRLEKFSSVEKAMKEVGQVLRVDFDKTTTQLNDNDVLKSKSLPELSFKLVATKEKDYLFPSQQEDMVYTLARIPKQKNQQLRS